MIIEKMNTRHFFQSAIFILAFSRFTFANNLRSCKIPSNFTIDLTNDEKANFYESEMTIWLNKDALAVTSYEGLNTVNVRTNENVIVIFKGNLVISTVPEEISTAPQRIFQSYVDRISGIAQRGQLNSTNSTMGGCRLVLLPVEMERPNVDQRIANEIRRLAESCVELEICPIIDEIPVQSDFQSSNPLALYVRDPIVAAMDPWKLSYPQGCEEKLNGKAVQLAINRLVDVALDEITANIIEQYKGPVILPNIHESFSIGSGVLKTTGYFDAQNGTFRDISSVRRMIDATLSHDRMKFMATCGFGLTIADLKFDHYKLTYGLIKVNGRMEGFVDGAAIIARIAVDYNEKPCQLSVEHLKVTEFGKMTVDLTGLGPLNSAASKLISWITKTWRDEIIQTIETEMRAAVETQFAALDCERFRPLDVN